MEWRLGTHAKHDLYHFDLTLIWMIAGTPISLSKF